MKKLLTILMLLTASLPLWAYDLEVDGIYYNKIVSTSTVQVTNYDSQANSNSYSGTVVIPETVSVNGVTYKVTSIGAYAFVDCENLTAIEIPGTVTEIGTNAFLHCYGLSSVTIADGETTLELANYQAGNWPRGLFFDCPIETLYLGRDLSYDINTQEGITRTPFSQITELTTLTIGNNVTKIGVDAFVDCSGLTEVIIPNNITSIGGGAFEGCTGLTEVIIPESVQEILGNTFKNCTGLTSVIIPNSVTSIGNYAFEGCTKLSTITCNATTPPAVEENSFPSYDVTLDIPTESLSLYLEHPVWSKFKFAITTLPLYYKVIDANNKYVEVINDASYASYNGPVIIPSTTVIDGVTYTVTSIGTYAFRDCTGLTLVAIPESVTSIGDYAFYGCTGLTLVAIPESVTSIGSSAFQYCTGLTSITIPNSVTSIRSGAFYGCTGLTTVTLGNSVTSIGHALFHSCTGLTSITIPNSVTSIGSNAFYGCTGLTEVTIGNGVTSIGNDAFAGCTGLTSVIIPNNITSIGQRAFQNCTGLTSITIPNSVTSIDYSAFYGCTGLTSVTLGNGVTSIGSHAFSYCSISNIYFDDIATICNGVWSALSRASSVNYYYNNELVTELVIPDSITSIGNNAFQNSKSLTSITIPNSVTSIGGWAFYGCTGLTEVTLGNGVTSIGNQAFESCTGLKEVTIPNSVTSIGLAAFSGCAGLKEVTIPNSVTSIGRSAFYGCTGLTEITIPNSVTSIGRSAFRGCTALQKVVIEDGDTVLNIGENSNSSEYLYLFENCPIQTLYLGRTLSYYYYCKDGPFYNLPTLTSLIISSNTTSIGQRAFQNCTGLTSITIPNSVTKVGIYAFDGCSISEIYFDDIATICNGVWPVLSRASSVNYYYNNELLTELVIPDSITSIGRGALYGCTSLTSITIPNSVTSIGAYALYGCTGLKEVTIPNSVTSIGDYALYGCTGLTSITIPNSVISIGGSAFSGCTGLTSITIPNSVASIDNNTFSGCTGLTSVTIPASVTSIGNSAFSGCTGLKEVIMEDGEAVLNLGNNNRKGLFNDCPIHTLYLGRTLSYDASSSGGYSPFYNQIYLKKLTIGNIRILSENLFKGCSNLVGNLTLSSSIDSIASNAFAGTGYKSCHILAAEPPVVVDAGALGNITFVRVPKGSRTAYKTADVWKDLTIVEEDPEYEVEITVTEPGKLSQDIVMEYMIVPQSVTKLKVHGTINVEDFKQMRTNMTSCYSIDLSDADCVALPDSAFEGKYYLTELILPNNCTSIGKAAFVNCSTLDSIVIPDNVSIIGERAFMNCKGLKFMGSGRYLSIIGEYAFQNCILLDNVTLPTGLKTIERYAFENCSTLTSIVIPNGVTSLGAGAFKNCISLVSASIPGTVEVVESYTFDNCKSLKELTLGEGVKTLSENAVRSGNFETFIIPSSLTNLGATSLSSTKIKKLIISDSENELYLPIYNWVGAFPNTGITYLYIGRDWRYQNAAASNFPNTITSVEIGPQVTTLKKIADCPNLKTLSVSSLNHLLSLTIESHPFATSGSGVLYIDGEAITNVVIPDNFTVIKDYTFLNCTNIEAVTLPDSITTIGNQAFKGCTSLTTVNLSDTLQSIGNEAFYNCEALANITCPALVPPTVGTDGFEGVDNYTCILTIPGDSLMNYMLAEHWGAFIQKRKRIDVDVETPVVDEGESEGESGSEGDSNTGTGTGNHCGGHIWYDRDWHKHHGGHHAPRRYAAAEEETAVSGIDATIGDGLSLFIATDSVVTFLIEPEEGYNIGSVRYGGVDVTDQLNNGVFTTNAVSANTKLEVSFVEGEAPVVAGDANDDATVNISDVVVIVNYILGDESGVASVDNADVNEDGVINIGDVPGVVNIILSASVQAAPIRYEGAEGVLSMNDVIIAQGETTGIEVSLDNAVPYTAFQMDVTLPEGLTANNITLSNRISSTHSLMWRMQEDNTLRVVVFAPDNSTIADNSGALFTIDVTAGSAFEGGHIVADNTIFTARDLTMHYLDGAEAAAINPAGVDGIYTADRIYTIGRTLVIESTCNQAAYITTTGGVMRAVELQAGRNEIAMLQQGLYIVVVGSETQKVIIR